MSTHDPSTMRERVEDHRFKLWILLRMDRRVLAGTFAAMVFAGLLFLSIVGPAPMARVIETADGLWWVFSSLITAVITVVALVVTFNQLVLSQELGAVGDQRERMEGARAFRTDVEAWLDVDVSPPDPATFMDAMLRSIETRADLLLADDAVGDQVESFAKAVSTDARSVRRSLDDAQFGTFDLLFALLNFNYSLKLYETRRLIAAQEDQLSEESLTALEELVSIFGYFGPAREHMKTLYFQWELVNLSRAMLLSSVPALIVAIGMLLFVDTAGLTATIFGIDTIVWLVAAGVIAVLTPFFILMAYILRIATVAKRTLAIGPFVLRDTDRVEN